MTRAAPLNDGLINANDFRVGVPYYTTVFDMFFVRCAFHTSIHGFWKFFDGIILVMQKPASEIREF